MWGSVLGSSYKQAVDELSLKVCCTERQWTKGKRKLLITSLSYNSETYREDFPISKRCISLHYNASQIFKFNFLSFWPTRTQTYTLFSKDLKVSSRFRVIAYLANWQAFLTLSREGDSKAGVLLSPQMQEMALHHHQQQHHHQHPDGAHYDPACNHPLINSSPPILPNPMSALSQLNPQVSRSTLPHGSPSPPGSKSATPSPSSSNQEEETDPHSKVLMRHHFYSTACSSGVGGEGLVVLLWDDLRWARHACASFHLAVWKVRHGWTVSLEFELGFLLCM